MNKYELNNIRIRITHLLNYGLVSNEDIRSLSNQNLFKISNSYDSEDFVSKLLFTIYINPYILCDDNLLKDKPILDNNESFDSVNLSINNNKDIKKLGQSEK